MLEGSNMNWSLFWKCRKNLDEVSGWLYIVYASRNYSQCCYQMPCSENSKSETKYVKSSSNLTKMPLLTYLVVWCWEKYVHPPEKDSHSHMSCLIRNNVLPKSKERTKKRKFPCKAWAYRSRERQCVGLNGPVWEKLCVPGRKSKAKCLKNPPRWAWGWR